MSEFQYLALVKAVSDDRDYLFDLTDVPEVLAGATLGSAEVLGGTGLTFGTPAVLGEETDGIAAGKGYSVRISGGVAGTVCTFALECTLSTGRTVIVPGRLRMVANY